jgi:hypothetical protein
MSFWDGIDIGHGHLRIFKSLGVGIVTTIDGIDVIIYLIGLTIMTKLCCSYSSD